MKTPKMEFAQKQQYYKSKKEALEERMLLLQAELTSDSNDALKKNTYKLEIIELEAVLEGVIEFWEHYTERVSNLQKEEESQTKEYELNNKALVSVFNSITQQELNNFQKQIRQQYDALKPRIEGYESKEQLEKLAYYFMLKEFLIRIKKIK